jgi:hypothetical protein
MADSDGYLQYNTPKKYRVKGAIEYMEARGIQHLKENVFRFNAPLLRADAHKLLLPTGDDYRLTTHAIEPSSSVKTSSTSIISLSIVRV